MTDCARCRVLEAEVADLERVVEKLKAEVALQRAWARSFHNQAQRLKKERANG